MYSIVDRILEVVTGILIVMCFVMAIITLASL